MKKAPKFGAFLRAGDRGRTGDLVLGKTFQGLGPTRTLGFSRTLAAESGTERTAPVAQGSAKILPHLAALHPSTPAARLRPQPSE